MLAGEGLVIEGLPPRHDANDTIYLADEQLPIPRWLLVAGVVGGALAGAAAGAVYALVWG